MGENSGEEQRPVSAPPDDTRADVNRIIAEEGKSQAAIAREAAVNPSTFSAWLNGTYLGRNDQVAEKVKAWLESRKVAQRTRIAMPRAPGFVMTDSAARFMTLLEHAQHAPDMVVLDGAPGLGKTTVCEEYQRRGPHVHLVTAEPAWNTPRMLLDRVAKVLGVTEKYSAEKVSGAIVERLRFTGGLLIVDEANHLSSASIDQLRTFHDLAKIGIALVGNASVYQRLEGEGRKTQFAQLFSRIGMRLSHTRPHDRDIDLLLDAWSVETLPERELLHIVARQPGALRGMTKTLRMAFLMAAGNPVTAREIKLSWAQISSTELTRKAS